MISWHNVIEPIVSDHIHGASHLFRLFLERLEDWLTDREDDSTIDTGRLAHDIASVRPEMAPFHYLAHRIDRLALPAGSASPSAVKKEIALAQSEMSTALNKIVERTGEITHKIRAVMLHSHSGMVLEVVKRSCSRDTKVFISEGRPECEGLKVAQILAEAGMTVDCFPDDARMKMLAEVEIVLLGTDWLGERDFLNKIGSRSLADGASAMNKPVFVVAEASKMVPATLRPPLAEPVTKLAENVSWRQPLLEAVPNSLVQAFLTADGLLSPDKVASQIETGWRAS